MSASQVDRFLGKTAGTSPRTEPKDLGFTADPAAGVRMIDFVQKNGDRFALSYAYLLAVRLIGGDRIELEFTDRKVAITGRNLLPLYKHFLAQTAREVEESQSGFDEGGELAWVSSVRITALG